MQMHDINSSLKNTFIDVNWMGNILNYGLFRKFQNLKKVLENLNLTFFAFLRQYSLYRIVFIKTEILKSAEIEHVIKIAFFHTDR